VFSDYVNHGWRICAITKGLKAPDYPGWNVNPIPAEAADGLDGAGLLHALSGTCAVDIDNMATARPWLAERGVDIDALLDAPDAVRIDSGRPGRAKLLYRLTRPLRTIKPARMGLELRCATGEGKSMQDVLPPTIHPDTKRPYEWAYGDLADGHWSRLPAIPAALLAVWRELAAGPEASPIAPSTGAPTVDLVKLRKAAFRHSPDAEYDEWLKVGMQLHDGTRGAQEGFDIWCDWSRGIKRKPYPGDGVLKAHWMSFNSSGGKHVAKGSTLVAELPADADEFPLIEPDAPAGPDTTEELLKAATREQRKASIETLEKRLVYIIGSEKYFDTERHKVIGSDNALEHMFTYMMPRSKGGRLSPVKVLKASATKRFVDNLGFHPGEGAIFAAGDDTFANTYRNRLPAPLAPRPDELERIEWLFNRIDDEAYRTWLKQFFAHVVQKPGVKINSAPLIWSETQGNGKTTLLKMIPALLVGANYSKEVTSGLLNSDFTDYLLNAWHVNLTEFRAGTRGEREAIAEKLKPWISDATISVHPKGLPAFTMPNVFFVTATSNKDDAAAIDNNDRRWGIHEMKALPFTEDEQTWVYEFLLSARAAGVLRAYFLSQTIDGFAPSAKAPETAARQEMAEASIPSDMELLLSMWEQRSAPFDRDVVLTNEIGEYVRKHCLAKPSNHRIGKILAKPPFNGKHIQFRAGEGRYRAIALRNFKRWGGTSGKEIMAHISGEDIDITS
jgi:hypothetical protein